MKNLNLCIVENCGRPVKSKMGYCNMHRQRFRRHGDPFTVKQIKIHPAKCTFPGCDHPYESLGYCAMHYVRLKTHGNPSIKKIRDSGAGTLMNGGYICIKKEGRSILLHRMLMEKHLGRKLDRYEIVHHVDGNTSNNQIENLEVIEYGYHTKMHIVMKMLSSIDENGLRHINNHLRRYGIKIKLVKII